MKLFGTPYTRGNSDVIESKLMDSDIPSGVCVKLDPLDSRKIVLFDGVGGVYGISGADVKSICGGENKVKSIVVRGIHTIVKLSSGSPSIGSLVYIQSDGTVGPADAGFGSFEVVDAPEQAIDWDGTSSLGIACNILSKFV